MTAEVKELSRREFVRTAAGGTAVAATAETAAAQEGQRHTIEMTDQLVFDPDSDSIEPGDTVVWENVGTIGHSVTAYEDEIPDEAEYFASGGFDTESAARNSYRVGDPESGDIAGGETFEHTFEVEGTYRYFCVPHESAGMIASLSVGVDDGGGDGDGFEMPPVPDEARLLVVGATAVIFSVVLFTYLFLKYGGDYGFGDDD